MFFPSVLHITSAILSLLLFHIFSFLSAITFLPPPPDLLEIFLIPLVPSFYVPSFSTSTDITFLPLFSILSSFFSTPADNHFLLAACRVRPPSALPLNLLTYDGTWGSHIPPRSSTRHFPVASNTKATDGAGCAEADRAWAAPA